jgi:hypothetical protein
MQAHLLPNSIEQIERAFYRGRAGELCRDPSGAEYGADPAFVKAGKIYAAHSVAAAQVKLLEEASLRDIDVSVDDKRAEVEFARATLKAIGRSGRGRRRAAESSERQQR